MDALSVAYSLLKSHEVIDLLIIMLGTNDVKERFNANAACIGAGMERLILKAKSVDCWGTKAPNILVVAPPRIGDGFHDAVMGEGCVEKSKGVAEQFRIVTERQNVHFLNAANCEFNQVDFMHLTRKATHSWLICWQRKCRRFYNSMTSRPGFLLRKPGRFCCFCRWEGNDFELLRCISHQSMFQ